MAKKFIHDPDCALTTDAAPTAEWDDPKYKPPACTCRKRQRARLTKQPYSATGSELGARDLGDKLPASGCYVTPIRRPRW